MHGDRAHHDGRAHNRGGQAIAHRAVVIDEVGGLGIEAQFAASVLIGGERERVGLYEFV